MPYKSKAQQRAMHAKADSGEIPRKVVDEFDKKTDFDKLPEKVKETKNKEEFKKRAGRFLEALAFGFFSKLAELPPPAVGPGQYGMSHGPQQDLDPIPTMDFQQSLDSTPMVDSLPNNMGAGMPQPAPPPKNPLKDVLINILQG